MVEPNAICGTRMSSLSRSRSNSNDSNSSGLTVILDSPAMVFQPKRNDPDDNNDDVSALTLYLTLRVAKMVALIC